MRENAYYHQVADEIARHEVDMALWAEAIARSNGDEMRARAIYIQLRVNQLRSNERKATVQGAGRRMKAGAAATTRATVSGMRTFIWGLSTIAVATCIVLAVAFVSIAIGAHDRDLQAAAIVGFIAFAAAAGLFWIVRKACALRSAAQIGGNVQSAVLDDDHPASENISGYLKQ